MWLGIGLGCNIRSEKENFNLDLIVDDIFWENSEFKANLEIVDGYEIYNINVGNDFVKLKERDIYLGVKQPKNMKVKLRNRVSVFIKNPPEYIWEKRDYRNYSE